MRCHYEVLGVPRDVDSTTLRAAYRKCALKWHPDKNLDSIDKAKEEFQLVQQAFEVLSDAQERAWYDNHREAILKGGFGDDYKDDCVNLFPYFSASCYQGYGDDEKGFYAVYREVFNKIYAEDTDFGDDDIDDASIPNFGNSDSSYEEVVHLFYAYWENYCTAKTFSWLDKFDIREAANRRVMRLMEKENKKAREKAKKERNEEIRMLVSFVRKRDKRLEKHRKILKERAAKNAKKAQLNRLRQLEERSKEIAESKEADWSKMENVESELKAIEANLASEFGDNHSQETNGSEDDAEVTLNHLYCVACNKMFKNEKSFANHENSKRHKDNVAAMKEVIESDYDCDDDDCSDVIIAEEVNSDGEINHTVNHINGETNENSTSKKKAKAKKVLKPMEECVYSLKVDSIGDEDDSENAFPEANSKKQKKKGSKRKVSNPTAANAHIKSSEAENPHCSSPSEDSVKYDQDSVKTQKGSDKKPKGKQNLDKQNKTFSNDKKDLNHTCAVCESTFPSKNKLFDHLKTTGHSVHIPKTTTLGKEKLPFKSKDKELRYSRLFN